MELAWHGSASLSLRAAGTTIVFDPCFSPSSAYGSWHIENPYRPALDDYLRDFRPDVLYISHGHYDHYDLETCKFIEREAAPLFVGSEAAAAAAERFLGTPEARRRGLESGEVLEIGGLRLRVTQAVHWLTGPEGDEAARKLDRPDRYGVMPCGGPMLSAWIEADGLQLYYSGDTDPEGVPKAEVDVAVLNIGNVMPHPVTKVLSTPTLTVEEVLHIVPHRLKARVVIPVHWDHPSWSGATDLETLWRELARQGIAVVVPPLNRWFDVARGV